MSLFVYSRALIFVVVLFWILFALTLPDIFKFLSPKDLCKGTMLTSKDCHEMSQADMIWSHVYKSSWGVVDDHACKTCRHLAPTDRSCDRKKSIFPHGGKNSLKSILDGDDNILTNSGGIARLKVAEDDDMMEDIVSGMELLDVSWLSGFKHR